MTRDYEALAAYIESRSNMPFDWNGNCCARFSLGAIEAQFGEAPELSFSWKTAIGAKRVIAARGGMLSIINEILMPIAPGAAMRGDIAGCPDDDLGLALLVIDGQMLIGPCENGIRHIPRGFMTHAWRAAPSCHNV